MANELYGMSKCILFVFNVIFLALAIILIVIGSSDFVDLHRIDTVHRFTYGLVISMMIVVIGVVLFFVSLVGCCGALQENKVLLIVYSSILLVMVIVQSGAAVIFFKNSSTTELTIVSLIKRGLEEYNRDETLREPINNLQSVLHCCGVDSPQDWTDVFNQTGLYPYSCCQNATKEDKVCRNLDYKEPCSEALKEFFDRNEKPLLWVVFFSILSMLTLFIISCVVMRNSRADYYRLI